MCLLTISVENTRSKVLKLARIAKNSGFSRLVLDSTFERKVIETTEILENNFGGVGACSCSLNSCLCQYNGGYISAKGARPKWLNDFYFTNPAIIDWTISMKKQVALKNCVVLLN